MIKHGDDVATVDPLWKPTLRRLSEVEAKPVEWLPRYEPLIPIGMPSMITGDPGSGKTYIALAIASELTAEGVPVLYLTKENSAEYTLRPRFDSLHGDPELFYILDGAKGGNPGDEIDRSVTLTDVDVIRDAVNETHAKLVVIDPIQSYLGAAVDAHRANETRPILDGLAKIAEQCSTAVLMLRHASKAGGNRAIHRGLGSIDFTGAVRSEMFAGTTNDGERALVHIKSNIGPYGATKGYEILAPEEDGGAGVFRWTGASNVTCADLTAPDEGRENRTDEAEQFLLDILKDGPREVKHIRGEARKAGISDRTLDLAKTKLGFISKKRLGDGAWVWPQLPEKRDQ